MDKTNFGSLISKLADDLPDYPEDEEDDSEMANGKSITPPPDFEDANMDKKPASHSTASTFRSPAKLKSMLSFRKEKS
jgi:hypothetical protein